MFLFPFFILLIILLYIWNHIHMDYWNRKNVFHIPAIPILGNVSKLLTRRCCFGVQFMELYNHSIAIDKPFVGIFVLQNRAILLRDPKLIKKVLVQDFNAFSSRFETTDSIEDSMGSINLFFAKYNIWKQIHNIFSPLFTHNKVKLMYPLLEKVSQKLEKHMDKLNQQNESSFTCEVKDLCALFTTDVIASIAFGIDANCLENPSAEFRQMCIEVNNPKLKRIFHLFTMFFLPQLVNIAKTHLYSNEYEEFMRKSISFIIAERERNGIKRNDLIDIFINLKRQTENSTTNIIQKKDFFEGQAAFLLLAGFDTSSSTIAFLLYELAKNQDIQKYLRSEIHENLKLNNGKLCYQTINEMEYLRMVVDEVLRLYPPTSFLDRSCTSETGYSLEQGCSYVIPKGMPVYISVLGLHRDEKLWPRPTVFDPLRFSPENRKYHVPMSYLPFGSGPRSCLGYLLGLLEVKIGIISILKKYSIIPCDQTNADIEFDPSTFVLSAKGGIYLRFIEDHAETLEN